MVEELTSAAGGPPSSAAVSRTYVYGQMIVSESQLTGSGSSASWATSFYGLDGHGSVRFLMDSSGNLTGAYDYDAFGILIHQTGSTPNLYLYSGEQFDPDLGFYILRSRYLSPAVGRFLSMDRFDGQIQETLTLHKYLYAGADPVDRSDPSGRSFIDTLATLANNLVIAAQQAYVGTQVWLILNLFRILQFLEAAQTALNVLAIGGALIAKYGQFSIKTTATQFSGNIGSDGEAEVRRLLESKGYQVLTSVQNNSGQGIDIIARSADGTYMYFEIKSTQTLTQGPLPLSPAQQDPLAFVESRLQDAARGAGRYSGISAEAKQVAQEALDDFRENAPQIQSFVGEVYYPTGYQTLPPAPVPITMTFRRWW